MTQWPNFSLELTAFFVKYDTAIYEAVALQILLGLLAYMILDGGGIAQNCGIALVAFWGRGRA
jgi:hypothetical protein